MTRGGVSFQPFHDAAQGDSAQHAAHSPFGESELPNVIFAAGGGQIESLAGLAAPRLAGSSRCGRLSIATPARSVWVQMRGYSRIDSRKGTLLLKRGDWISLASDSLPEIRSDRYGLTLGMVLPSGMVESTATLSNFIPFIGRGTVPKRALQQMVRLWRKAAFIEFSEFAIRAFLLSMSCTQVELFDRIRLCPGKSFRRKREWFEKLQNVVLYLDGNSHRAVRISELAAIASCSVWHLTKTFRSVYGLNPGSVAKGFRLARARHLLESTTWAIAEVSGASGFDSPAAFARAFRSENGMSASQYRAVRRSENEGSVDNALFSPVDMVAPSLPGPARTLQAACA